MLRRFRCIFKKRAKYLKVLEKLICVKKKLKASRHSEHLPNQGVRGVKTCLKKNLNASRPSKHPPVSGKSVKTFKGGIIGCKVKNLFMAFKRVPRWK